MGQRLPCGGEVVGFLAGGLAEVASAACGGVQVAGTEQDPRMREKNKNINTNDNYCFSFLDALRQKMMHHFRQMQCIDRSD